MIQPAIRPLTLGLIALITAWLLGCASNQTSDLASDQPAQASGMTYQCDDGKRFVAEFNPGGESATVTISGTTLRLPKVPADSGVKYSDGNITLSAQEQKAHLEIGSRLAFRNCAIKP